MPMQPHSLSEVESVALILENDQYRNELRRRAQTDLLFLARLLGYDKMVDRVHRPMAMMRVQKNPDLPLEEQAAIKQGLDLDPRGVFKSTWSIIDSVQWVICFPNVRICKLTATKPLATAIVGEIADSFVRPPNTEDAELPIFQALFREYLISPREKRTGEYTAPCRTRNWREATVMGFSNETAFSGWHFDVIDPDDIVETNNSRTAQSIALVKKNWRINKKTLMPWGYVNFNGTRYHPFDLWGDIIDKATPGKIRLLVRAVMKLKDGRRLEPSDWPDNFPQASEVELLFPELLPYEFLKQEFEEDYESFATQYMNDAHGGKEIVFTRESLLAASVTAEQVPFIGQTVCAWRFPCKSKAGMEYAGGAVGILDGGRLCIMDVARGKFTPSALAHKVVQLAKKHGCRNIEIEDTPGARYYEPAILNYAAALNWQLQITWLEFQEDDGVRDIRIKGVEPLLPAMRVAFAGNITGIRELFRQFTNYGMIEENELPDVIARLAEKLPRLITIEDTDAEQDLAWELARQRDMFDRTHGIGQYAPPETPTEQPYQEPRSELSERFGLEDVLGGLNG